MSGNRPGARTIAIAALALGGYLHFHLVRGVYRHAPIREMFVLNVAASAFLVVLLAVTARRLQLSRLAAAGGAALALGSLAAFALSRGPGLPTLHGLWKETGLSPTDVHVLGAKIAVVVLITEAIALLACVGLVMVERPEPST